MFFLLWALFAVCCALAMHLVLGKLGHNDPSKRRGWRPALVNLLTLVLVAVPAWWLLDIPGQIRFSKLVRAGDYSAASLPQNRAHPLVALTGAQMAMLVAIVLAGLGGHMAVSPGEWADGTWWSSSPEDPALLRRLRVYGVVICALGLGAVTALLVVAPGSFG